MKHVTHGKPKCWQPLSTDFTTHRPAGTSNLKGTEPRVITTEERAGPSSFESFRSFSHQLRTKGELKREGKDFSSLNESTADPGRKNCGDFLLICLLLQSLGQDPEMGVEGRGAGFGVDVP